MFFMVVLVRLRMPCAVGISALLAVVSCSFCLLRSNSVAFRWRFSCAIVVLSDCCEICRWEVVCVNLLVFVMVTK